MNSTLKSLILWMAILLALAMLWQAFNASTSPLEEPNYSEFMAQVEQGTVEKVTIKDSVLTGSNRDSEQKFTVQLPNKPTNEWIDSALRERGIDVTVKDANPNPLVRMLFNWAPILLLVGLWIFFMRQMQSGGNRAMSFGKSKAKLLNSSGKKVTFADVAGIDEAKEELGEIVEFLREPQKFQKLGGRIPKGVLLMGPPGTGKTLLARAIAGEANVPFFSISGSDFVEMFVGVGASRVRDLFEQGTKNAPCIIFIDEIDAVGRHRGAGLGGGHDEREQTLNQLLVEMDGFESNEGVILIAATNRPDVLDPALLRPGRFDRRIVVDRPDINGRLGILEVHTRDIPLAEGIDLRVIARGTPGFAGADLANLVNEAALIAARRDKQKVDLDDFEFAKDKIMMGAERKTLMLTDDEKQVTAVHEAGHAVVAAFTKGADPVHKVTIIPRGRALGLTMQLPTEDKHNYGKRYIVGQIAILMGGRVAEELTRDDITTGASSDIERASALARSMVCEWGMSELGPLSYGSKEEPVFLGREFAQRATFSPETALRIDAEVEKIVQSGYQSATDILTEQRAVLDAIALELLDKESIEGSHVYDTIQELTGQDLAPPPAKVTDPSPPTMNGSQDDSALPGAESEAKAEMPAVPEVSSPPEASAPASEESAAKDTDTDTDTNTNTGTNTEGEPPPTST